MYQGLAPTLIYLTLPRHVSLSLHEDAVSKCDPPSSAVGPLTFMRTVPLLVRTPLTRYRRLNFMHTNSTSVDFTHVYCRQNSIRMGASSQTQQEQKSVHENAAASMCGHTEGRTSRESKGARAPTQSLLKLQDVETGVKP
ncbi:Hypothetical predicted protein [Pelobates cultripes]|uniref:Uncharacterized protein n=1 Tax=Pelobates cultripes TaxID=61616 RepID=A0AAD1T749_PELCU|nr:Hypothetical predicted protein [Pelobates cultripes]